MDRTKSYQSILRAAAIMGSSSVLNIIFGILRMKVAAVLLGPAGIGVIGLMQSIMQTASVFFGLGIDTAGTRKVADEIALNGTANQTRRVLWLGSIALATIGGISFFLFAPLFTNAVIGDMEGTDGLQWLGAGVAMMVIGMGVIGVINGHREIKWLATMKAGSSAAAMVIGSVALYLFGDKGIVIFVISLPMALMMIGLVALARFKEPMAPTPNGSALMREWGSFTRLSSKFMIGALVSLVGPLVIRVIIHNELGVEQLGQFEAAWMISSVYIGFVLGAMATDYFPRLTSVISDEKEASQLVNEQTLVALYLVGPVLVIMMAFAPLVLTILYSAEFVQSAELFRLQIIGDLLKVVSWPLSFIILAKGRGTIYILTEVFAMTVYGLATYHLIQDGGINGAGLAFIAMYVLYLPTVYMIARSLIRFSWTGASIRQFLAVFASLGVVFIAINVSQTAGAVIGLVLFVCLAWLAKNFLISVIKSK